MTIYLCNLKPYSWKDSLYIDGLVQERRNSIANALELCLSCTNPSILRWARDVVVVNSSCYFSCLFIMLLAYCVNHFTNLVPALLLFH